MCSFDDDDSVYDSRSGVTPVSKMYTGACGRFTILCFILCLVFCIATIVQAGRYVNSVDTDQHILCSPSASTFWIVLLIFWCSVLILLLFSLSLWFLDKCVCAFVWVGMISTWVIMPSILLCVVVWYLVPLANTGGAVIQPYNTSFMYQYGWMNGRPVAFPILLNITDLNEATSDLTCSPYKTRDLCPPRRNRLSKLGISTVFRCIPKDDEGLHFILSYLEPLSNISQSAVNLHATFVAFLIFVTCMTMYRRFVPQEKWFDNYICKLSNVGIDEKSPLLGGRLSRII